MLVADHSLTLDEGRKFRIYPIGDLHLTLKSFKRNEFKRYVQTIANDPAAAALVMGDVTDARSRDHKFFAPEMVHPRYLIEDLDIIEDKAAEEAAELFAPIADKIIGIHRGNHHKAGFTHSLRRELRHIAGVNVPDLGDRAVSRVRLEEQRGRQAFAITIFSTHRDSGGAQPGSQFNNQIRSGVWCDADIYLFAHSHRSSFQRQPRITLPTSGRLTLKRRDAIMINAGSWLDALPMGNSYADEKNLPLQNDDIYYIQGYAVSNPRELRLIPVTWD